MKTKLIRVEQETADMSKVDKIVNEEIKNLESKGNKVKDVRIAVGRDAWEGSGITIKYSVTILIMYE